MAFDAQTLIDFMMLPALGKPLWMWLSFTALVLFLLALDLGVLNRKNQVISVRHSLVLSVFYISLGLIYGAGIWFTLGADAGMNYLTGFAVEKALAIDNIFVIAMIFSFFAVPDKYQHRVLFWGILGVIILRAIMIALGAAVISEFSWVLYVFAVFLIATGIKMLLASDKPTDISTNPILRLMKRWLRVTETHHEERFFVRLPDTKTGKTLLHVTPLFMALVLIEIADVVFAVDSVPAIFAITTDPFIVYTSNIFAILGLRALYFALSAMIERFHYLKYALAIVLIFIGTKIFAADLLGIEKIPPAFSLAAIVSIIGAGVVVSMIWSRSQPKKALGQLS